MPELTYLTIIPMIGKVFNAVTRADDDEELVFTTDFGETFTFHHDQDCCESVTIEDIEGDLKDLEGATLVLAAVATSENYEVQTEGPDYADSQTYTFYRFGTFKGYVTVRWYGTSNGYYSETVQIEHKIQGKVITYDASPS